MSLNFVKTSFTILYRKKGNLKKTPWALKTKTFGMNPPKTGVNIIEFF